jgi:hypothetical protein
MKSWTIGEFKVVIVMSSRIDRDVLGACKGSVAEC